MRRLEPVVAHLVEQIFGLLREATVGEIAELRATECAAERRPRRPLKPSAAPSFDPRSPRKRSPTRLPFWTDSPGRKNRKLRRPRSPHSSRPCHALTAPPRLHAGETVVRATGAGFVIRRRGHREPSPGELDAAASGHDDAQNPSVRNTSPSAKPSHEAVVGLLPGRPPRRSTPRTATTSQNPRLDSARKPKVRLRCGRSPHKRS